ncbi:hypothetical protein, partial [Acidisphaera rubrifaciens]|uniref:hypothetical protein n=1 Tax=Acidisphaera rubrifaciens TaxID=50715 RepID=UPI000662159B
MHDDRDEREARRRRREAQERRLDEERIDMLLAAARTLVPDLGVEVPLSRLAVHAGLSRRAAAALFDTTAEVAAALVRATWRRLAEVMADPAAA